MSTMTLIDYPTPETAIIWLNDPKTLNSMSFELIESLLDALASVGKNNRCRAAILTGKGHGFCSGMNLDDVGLPPNTDDLTLARLAERAMGFMAKIVPAMRALPQPLIAAINGPAYGGGFCLSLGADIRIGSQSARFRGAGISNGLTGTELGISYLLPRLIGAAHSNELLLTGREVKAEEAYRLGLISQLTDEADLLDTAKQIADQIGAHSVYGVQLTKQALWAGLETGSLAVAIELETRNQLLIRMTTKNLEEAIQARNEKRKAVFKD